MKPRAHTMQHVVARAGRMARLGLMPRTMNPWTATSLKYAAWWNAGWRAEDERLEKDRTSLNVDEVKR